MMGSGARALTTDPNVMRELHTWWDGSVEINVAAADYDCETQLPGYWVRGIEVGSVAGGNAVKVDHYDVTQTDQKRTAQTLRFTVNIPKVPLPYIYKVYKTGTTATQIRLYFQRAR
jgi:hypothetical protein